MQATGARRGVVVVTTSKKTASLGSKDKTSMVILLADDSSLPWSKRALSWLHKQRSQPESLDKYLYGTDTQVHGGYMMLNRPIAEELMSAVEEARTLPGFNSVTAVVCGLGDGAALAALNLMVLAANPSVHRVTVMTESCPNIFGSDTKGFFDGLRREPVVDRVVFKPSNEPEGAAPPAPEPMSRVVALNIMHLQV
jgi:hypothetical protein